jgi:hypothetical protein
MTNPSPRGPAFRSRANTINSLVQQTGAPGRSTATRARSASSRSCCARGGPRRGRRAVIVDGETWGALIAAGTRTASPRRPG